ncbi:MAG: class I SAM-dependent methyltransferase, partial [Deltaproteobacteria bacterium]|nr:class I SAM-dependent methyltransferase [Deltaproteobacteria bacterium]
MKFEKNYYEQSSLWEQATLDYQKELIEEIRKIIPDDVRNILDAGCGNGIISNNLIDKYDITAVDISETSLKYVKADKKFLASVDNLPFENESFDLVMVNDVLEHLNDETFIKALSEIERVAKKYIIVTSPFMENLKFNFTRCHSCKREFHINLHKRSFSFRDINKIFSNFNLCKLVFCGRLYQSTITPFVEIRHKLGEYLKNENSICPFCGEKQKLFNSNVRGIQSRIIDLKEFIFLSENREKWMKRPDRQEFVGLFVKGYEINDNSVSYDECEQAEFIYSNVIRFSEIQRQYELKPFYPYPQYQILTDKYENEGNLLRIKSEKLTDVLKFSFPYHNLAESVLYTEFISNCESLLTISAYDSVNDRFYLLKEVSVLSGESELSIDAIESGFLPRFGSLFQLGLRGDISLKKVTIKGVEPVYQTPVLKTDGYIRRNFKGANLYLRTETEEIRPFWFYEDIDLLSEDGIFNKLSPESESSLNEKVLNIMVSAAERSSNEITKLLGMAEDADTKRGRCEEMYQQALKEVLILNEALARKENERSKAEEIASKYLEDLKLLEERYNE